MRKTIYFYSSGICQLGQEISIMNIKCLLQSTIKTMINDPHKMSALLTQRPPSIKAPPSQTMYVISQQYTNSYVSLIFILL